MLRKARGFMTEMSHSRPEVLSLKMTMGMRAVARLSTCGRRSIGRDEWEDTITSIGKNKSSTILVAAQSRFVGGGKLLGNRVVAFPLSWDT